MANRYETTLYTQEQFNSARTRSRALGWVQGGLVTASAFLVLNVIGWIPMMLLAAVAGYAGYRFVNRR